MLPITKHGFELSKQQFWDSVRLHYSSEIANLPIFCPCGSKFDIQHSINCWKGGFVRIRQNHLRDLFAKIVSEVCKDTEIEPKLLPLPGYELHGRTTNVSSEERLDIRAQGFWNRDQQTFFDIRVFDPNACRYLTNLCNNVMQLTNMRKGDCTTIGCSKSTKERSHLWYFQFTLAWEENAICFIHGCLS